MRIINNIMVSFINVTGSVKTGLICTSNYTYNFEDNVTHSLGTETKHMGL